MALPAIFRRLFRDNGYGSLLKPEIIPFTADASSNADDVAASTRWVRNATDGYVNGLSISGTTITYTKGNGATGTLTTQDTTYSAATQSADGLMSAADKQKLDNIVASAGKYTLVDTWDGSSAGESKWISKTITGCTVGKPVILGFSVTYNTTGGITFRITAGCDYGYTGGTSAGFSLTSGSNNRDAEGVLTAVLIPNASTISMNLFDFESGEHIYIYMQ